MKLGITLIIIGILLFIDGMFRIASGASGGGPWLMIGGLFTGIILGGFIFYKGLRRIQRYKKPNPPQPH